MTGQVMGAKEYRLQVMAQLFSATVIISLTLQLLWLVFSCVLCKIFKCVCMFELLVILLPFYFRIRLVQ